MREYVEQRLHQLEPRDRRVVECAALLGFHIDPVLLAECAGCSLEAALYALRRALELDVVVTHNHESGELRFRHALTQTAIQEGLDRNQTRALHAAIVSALECRRDAASRGDQVAHHRLRAAQ